MQAMHILTVLALSTCLVGCGGRQQEARTPQQPSTGVVSTPDTVSNGASDTIQDPYLSPKGTFLVLYTGAEYLGDGQFALVQGSDTSVFLKENFRYGPNLCWLSDSVAAIRVGTGSQLFHMYYYHCGRRQRSRAYELVAALDTAREVVACYDDEAITFYRIFSGKLLLSYKFPEIGIILPWLATCDPKAFFTSSGDFRMSWQCGRKDTVDGQPSKQELTIKLPR